MSVIQKSASVRNVARVTTSLAVGALSFMWAVGSPAPAYAADKVTACAIVITSEINILRR